MSYDIEFSPEGDREFRKLPGHVRPHVEEEIENLSKNPTPSHAKPLVGYESTYRIWIKRVWRMVYEITEELKLVTIVRIRRKSSVDYENLPTRKKEEEK